MTDKVACGAVFGRFQPLHRGHLAFIEDAASRVEHLTVGVTRPYPELGEAGTRRTSAEANPLPYWLRLRSLSEVLARRNLSDRVSIIPMPLRSDAVECVFPPGTVLFTTVLNDWGEEKEEILRASGRPVLRLAVRSRTPSGTEIRELARRGNSEWTDHLAQGMSPETVALMRSVLQVGQ